MRRSLTLALAGAVALATTTPAAAAIVNYNGTNYTAGQTITIAFSGQADGVPVPGLSSELDLTFTGVDGNGDYQFAWDLANTSTMNPLSTVVAFGFNVDPNLTGATVTGDFTNTSSGSITNGFTVEFCATGGPNCSGGSNTGPTPGTSFDGNLLLMFAGSNDPGTIFLTQPIVRYQSTGPNGGGSAIGRPTPPVPEPGTWAMMLIGFGAAGYSLRRRGKGLLQVA